MRGLIRFLIAALLILAWVLWRGRRVARTQRAQPVGDKASPSPNLYVQLRDTVLQGSRLKLGLPPASTQDEPFAVMMDWGISSGTATVVAIADGNASVYLSQGGGAIGGGQSQASVRALARETVSLATEVRPRMQFARTFPLPRPGEVTFYVLTDAGIFTASATEDDLQDSANPFHKLGGSLQALLSQYQGALR
ncbi:MAG: hypothetical protein JST79_03035 [Acidobacteria bacterium]|nr:hypothetical protein [Acidobacteriota bacterium]